MYRVVVFFEDRDGERVYFADIKAKVRRGFSIFCKPQINVGLDLASLEPAPMSKEDAEFTAKLAYLAFRGWGAVRVEVQELTKSKEPINV